MITKPVLREGGGGIGCGQDLILDSRLRARLNLRLKIKTMVLLPSKVFLKEK